LGQLPDYRLPNYQMFSVPLPDGRELELGARTLVMGIVNVTPDSFADGGARFDAEVAIADAVKMALRVRALVSTQGETSSGGGTFAAACRDGDRQRHSRLFLGRRRAP
jgi:hypothetical protein